MHFCYLLVYVILSCNKLVSIIAFLGLHFQNGTFGSEFSKGGLNSYNMVLGILSFIFYIGAIYVCFHAYREFKGMMFDQG
jgi:hypothetical protein